MTERPIKDDADEPKAPSTFEDLLRLATTGKGPAIMAGAMVLACAGGVIAWLALRSSLGVWLKAGGFRVPPELEQDWAEFVVLMDEKGRDWSRST
ncbi:MAG TPA: hypothetical protein VG248_02660 [Caulobacteraceae bacterium]|jgi:hypothetical protein|nr:hypothetical protein [Caulobacteraceae bacterium]